MQEAGCDRETILHRGERVCAGMRRHSHERSQGREPDEFRFAQSDAVLGRHRFDLIPDPPHGRRREVEQVHRHLGAVELLDHEAVGLHGRQPAAGFADSSRDPPGQFDVGRFEVDVPGDQERPGAHGHGTGPRMRPCRPEVGSSSVLPDLVAKALVAAAPHVGQAYPVRTPGGARVQVDGDRKALGDAASEGLGHGDRIVEGGVTQRHERDHVDRADPRVLAGVPLHVDVADRDLDGGLERPRDRFRLPGHGQDGAIVRGVARSIQEVGTAGRRDRFGQGVDDRGPAPLGVIWNGFEKHPAHRDMEHHLGSAGGAGDSRCGWRAPDAATRAWTFGAS